MQARAAEQSLIRTVTLGADVHETSAAVGLSSAGQSLPGAEQGSRGSESGQHAQGQGQASSAAADAGPQGKEAAGGAAAEVAGPGVGLSSLALNVFREGQDQMVRPACDQPVCQPVC